ncbi:MAG: hypothetical protein V3R83_10965 [Gammaproteobacteria bacterium]
MSRLPNPRHENVARLYVLTGNAAKSHREAGYTPHRQNAHRMITSDDMQKRIGELAELGESKSLSPEMVKGALMSRALDEKTPANAAIRALELLGKTQEGGQLFVDRIENFDSATPEAIFEALQGILPDDMLDQLRAQYGISTDSEAEGGP